MRERLVWIALVLAATALGFWLRSRLLGDRYVKTFRYAEVKAVSYPGDTSQMDALLEAIRADAEAGGLLAGMDEILHLTLDGKVAYTITLRDGQGRIEKGAAAGTRPTLVVPIVPQYLENVREMVADQKLDDAERFNLGYVLLIPCVQRIHQMYYFTAPGDKEAFGVDDYMQFAIKNPQGYTYHRIKDEKVEIAATVLNVDGYFFYQPGLIGDPDVRYEFTFDGALELYKLLIYEAERSRNDTAALFALGTKVNEQLTRAITYQRSWH